MAAPATEPPRRLKAVEDYETSNGVKISIVRLVAATPGTPSSPLGHPNTIGFHSHVQMAPWHTARVAHCKRSHPAHPICATSLALHVALRIVLATFLTPRTCDSDVLHCVGDVHVCPLKLINSVRLKKLFL